MSEIIKPWETKVKHAYCDDCGNKIGEQNFCKGRIGRTVFMVCTKCHNKFVTNLMEKANEHRA